MPDWVVGPCAAKLAALAVHAAVRVVEGHNVGMRRADVELLDFELVIGAATWLVRLRLAVPDYRAVQVVALKFVGEFFNFLEFISFRAYHIYLCTVIQDFLILAITNLNVFFLFLFFFGGGGVI